MSQRLSRSTWSMDSALAWGRMPVSTATSISFSSRHSPWVMSFPTCFFGLARVAVILVGYWAFPFVFLLSRWTKRIVPSLVFFAVWQLAFHWLDMYWNIMPQFDWTTASSESTTLVAGPLSGPIALHHVGFSVVDITAWLALIGLLLAAIGRGLTGNLIPVKDPTLGLSLGHEQL